MSRENHQITYQDYHDVLRAIALSDQRLKEEAIVNRQLKIARSALLDFSNDLVIPEKPVEARVAGCKDGSHLYDILKETTNDKHD